MGAKPVCVCVCARERMARTARYCLVWLSKNTFERASKTFDSSSFLHSSHGRISSQFEAFGGGRGGSAPVSWNGVRGGVSRGRGAGREVRGWRQGVKREARSKYGQNIWRRQMGQPPQQQQQAADGPRGAPADSGSVASKMPDRCTCMPPPKPVAAN